MIHGVLRNNSGTLLLLLFFSLVCICLDNILFTTGSGFETWVIQGEV